jgi:hypothetical protein
MTCEILVFSYRLLATVSFTVCVGTSDTYDPEPADSFLKRDAHDLIVMNLASLVDRISSIGDPLRGFFTIPRFSVWPSRCQSRGVTRCGQFGGMLRCVRVAVRKSGSFLLLTASLLLMPIRSAKWLLFDFAATPYRKETQLFGILVRFWSLPCSLCSVCDLCGSKLLRPL